MLPILWAVFGIAVWTTLIKVCQKLSDYLERRKDKQFQKRLEKQFEKAYNKVTGRGLLETYRRGKLSINNLALLLEAVKEVDPLLYDDVVRKLSDMIRKEEIRKGLAKPSELIETPSFFGDDSDDDLITLDKDL